MVDRSLWMRAMPPMISKPYAKLSRATCLARPRPQERVTYSKYCNATGPWTGPSAEAAHTAAQRQCDISVLICPAMLMS